MTDLSSEAAKYLIKVSEDDKLYASYFWWRDFYTTTRNDWAEVGSSNLSFHSSHKKFFSRRCAPCAPPSIITPPPPLWSPTWSSGGKQTPNVAPTLCDIPEECHQLMLFKAVILEWYLMPIYVWDTLTIKLLSSSVFPLVFGCGGWCAIMLLSMTILPSYSLPDQNFYGATCDSLCQPGHEYYLSLWGIISIFLACQL